MKSQESTAIALSASLLLCSGLVHVAHGKSPSATPCPAAAQQSLSLPTGAAAAASPRGPIPLARSVAESDLSTSRVIHPDINDQVTCGRAKIQSFRDVVFATRKLADGRLVSLRMDIQRPKRSTQPPLVIYVTGGGFVRAVKENALNLRTYVSEAGFAVASIQYRVVADGADYRDGLADVKSAIRYLRANAGRYRIDARKVALWGESAGGYLVTMVGLTNGDKAFDVGENLDQSSDVQAVIDKFGPSDISKVGVDFDPAMQGTYADPDHLMYRYVPRNVAAANPLSHIDGSDPEFLIFSGSRDAMISPTQTLMLHDALRSAGTRSTRVVLEGANHGDMAFAGDLTAGLPWSTHQTMNIMVDFLVRKLGDSQKKSVTPEH